MGAEAAIRCAAACADSPGPAVLLATCQPPGTVAPASNAARCWSTLSPALATSLRPIPGSATCP